MQARHPPLILVFDETHRAISHHDDCQSILASHEKTTDVIFTGQSAVGAVAHEISVDIDGVNTLGAADAKHDLRVGKFFGEIKSPSIYTGCNSLRQIWWRTTERHLNIRVMRKVAGILHRPITWHGDGSLTV